MPEPLSPAVSPGTNTPVSNKTTEAELTNATVTPLPLMQSKPAAVAGPNATPTTDDECYDKRELISALSASSRSTHFPSHQIKFTSAETESNTHANSYTFASVFSTPSASPLTEISNPLAEVCEEELAERIRVRTTSVASDRHRGSRGSRNSVGTFNGSSRAGSSVEGHFIDPNSPSAAFEQRVAFDTFNNKYATDFSLTLQSKHTDYHYTRLSRMFMCGTDKNLYSEKALSWLLEELADDGDEILCLRVIDPSSKMSNFDKSLNEKQYRDEANKFLEHLISKNTKDKKISLILEFAVGRVQTMIKRMIQIYEPSILVVGTKGRSMEGFKGLLPGSISKWCLQHSPIPVVVVQPIDKREQSRSKREADPKKESYMDMIAHHPQDKLNVYRHMSTSDLAEPLIPIYLQHGKTIVSAPGSIRSSSDDLLDKETARINRFDFNRAPRH